MLAFCVTAAQEVKTTPPQFTTPLKDLTAQDGDELVLSAVVTGTWRTQNSQNMKIGFSSKLPEIWSKERDSTGN